ncbi:MAG: aurora kinase A-interacting protein [Acidimicrobiia bacterium]
MGSLVKKRRQKMSKHKYRKRRKAQRHKRKK